MRKRHSSPELAAASVDVQVAEMTKPADLAKAVDQTISTYGRIDAVVACAGYGLAGSLEELSYDQIVHLLSVNTAATAEVVRLALPHLKKERSGVIIAVSSIAGRMGFAGYSAYSASKFALWGLLESLWYEVNPYGIRLRLIEPSPVNTPFWTNLVGKAPKLTSKGLIRRSYKNISVTKQGLSAETVAKQIYRSALSPSQRLHWPVGLTGPLLWIKMALPDGLYRRLLQKFW